MKTQTLRSRIYDGEGDRLMGPGDAVEKVVLLPDSTSTRDVSNSPKLRLLWGQYLLEDILAGRYRTLVCSVNAFDNSRGIIAQVAAALPTSQWDEPSITAYAKRFPNQGKVTVIKYDMDAIEVLALLRPTEAPSLRLEDVALGFKIVAEMIRRKTSRLPVASVSFLGGRANRLVDAQGNEPTFETVLRTMYEVGFSGDVYPAPWMWGASSTGVYARYPFPESSSRCAPEDHESVSR
ncbi:MAG: hypothetical protein HC834_03120 [Rhodospirillales bacterium]|nr:hypothetical protein [Rhodospirillales bacterium]